MKNRLSDHLNGLSTNINCLRFISAILVLICHSYAITAGEEDVLYNLTGGECNLGGFAVAIFFFLSGMYVTKSLYKSQNAGVFMKKRCIRLFPQLWIVVAISAFVLGPVVTELPLKQYFMDFKTYLYLLNGILIPIHELPGVFSDGIYSTVNGPLWTMPVEFVAYIGLAAMTLLCSGITGETKNRKIQKILHILSFVGLVFIFGIVNIVIERNGFLSTVVRPMILFFVGVLYCDYADKIVLNVKWGLAGILLLIISGIVGIFNVGLMIMLPYIITSLALPDTQIGKTGELFEISYEMYLVGWPIQQVLFMFSNEKMSPVMNILLTIPIDILLAWLLYKCVALLENKMAGRKKNR